MEEQVPVKPATETKMATETKKCKYLKVEAKWAESTIQEYIKEKTSKLVSLS